MDHLLHSKFGMDSATLTASFIDTLTSATKATLKSRSEEVAFDSEAGVRRLDLLFELELPNTAPVSIAAEVIRHGYPRDVRSAVYQLQEYQQSNPEAQGAELFIVAEQLSPGARDDLRRASINYFDAGGSLFFQHGPILVDIERPPTKTKPRRAAQLFSSARERVVHAILEHCRREGRDLLGVNELAHFAETSPYTASMTLQELDKNDWVETTGSGPLTKRRLTNPNGLLDAWASAWHQRRDVRTRWFLPTMGRSSNITDQVLHEMMSRPAEGWALTGAAAANAVVPHLTSVDRLEIMVRPGLADGIASQLALTRADKGFNVTLVEREGAPFMFLDGMYERPNSYFASRFVQYLDLLDGVGRNKELAQVFREKTLQL